MVNLLWEEFLDVKYKEFYLVAYLERQQKIRKYFKIGTLILSISGIFRWKYFEDYAVFVLILISILQLLDLLKANFIRSEEEINEIVRLRMNYFDYALDLEEFFVEASSKKYSNDTIRNRIYDVRKKIKESIQSDAVINIKENKYVKKKASKEIINYIRKYGYVEKK